MTGTYNAGTPLYTDGGTYAMAAWRRLDAATAVIDAGTTTAVSPAGGVFPSGSGAPLQVAAGAGLTVTVNAGYCSVPATSGSGTYLFGLLGSAVLTVAANSSGSTRKDYVLANVQDLGNSGSFAQAEYVTGTTSVPAVPSNSVILAEVDVTNGAASITGGMITDKRTFVVAPGGVLPVSSLAAAPVSPAGQLFYDLGAGRLSMPLTWGSAVYQRFITPLQNAATYALVSFTADGVSDYKISTGFASVSSVTTRATAGIAIFIDDVPVDKIIFRTNTAGTGLVNYTYCTSGAQGTTLSAGDHLVLAALVSDGNTINGNPPGFLRVARAPQ